MHQPSNACATNAPIIIGVDPGSRHTGYGIIQFNNQTIRCIAYGRISTTAQSSTVQRLAKIHSELSVIIDQYQPVEAAIERVFVCHNVSSALKLGQARGAAMVALCQLDTHEYSPRQIKLAMVGYGNASKNQMQTMAMQLLQLKALPTPDAADALAIAICHAHCRHFQQRLAKSIPQ